MAWMIVDGKRRCLLCPESSLLLASLLTLRLTLLPILFHLLHGHALCACGFFLG